MTPHQARVWLFNNLLTLDRLLIAALPAWVCMRAVRYGTAPGWMLAATFGVLAALLLKGRLSLPVSLVAWLQPTLLRAGDRVLLKRMGEPGGFGPEMIVDSVSSQAFGPATATLVAPDGQTELPVSKLRLLHGVTSRSA